MAISRLSAANVLATCVTVTAALSAGVPGTRPRTSVRHQPQLSEAQSPSGATDIDQGHVCSAKHTATNCAQSVHSCAKSHPKFVCVCQVFVVQGDVRLISAELTPAPEPSILHRQGA